MLLKKADFCPKRAVENKLVASEFVPLELYLKYILEGQFQVKIYNGAACIMTIDLEANDFDCDTCCIIFQSACMRMDTAFCIGCTALPISELDFQLIQHDPMVSTLVDWYNSQSAEFADFSKNNQITSATLKTALKNFSKPDCDQYVSGIGLLVF